MILEGITDFEQTDISPDGITLRLSPKSQYMYKAKLTIILSIGIQARRVHFSAFT